MTTTKPSATRAAWLLLALLWGLLLVLAAWRPLALPDEGRYGEIGRWMLVSGDWLTPRLNGIPFFHKPPLLYWLEAAAISAFGVHAWALRLVPALHAGLMLAALYFAAWRMGGHLLARRATVMLGTSLSFLIGGQYINHDMMVASWIGVSIWAFALSFMHGDKPHAAWALLGFAASALGVLSKGLIGLALPGLVLLAWLLWTRQLHKALHLPWLRGVLIFSAIAVPWFVLVHQHYPGALGYLFGTQQVSRFTGTGFNNVRPWWFYLVCVLVLMFPWVLFVRPGKPRRPASPSWPATREAASNTADAWRALLWIWVLVIMGFFTIPASKLIGYALPVMPPLALLAAQGYGVWAERSRWVGPRLLASLAALAVLLGVGGTVLSPRYTHQPTSADVARTLAHQAGATDTVYAVDGFPYDLPFYAGTQRPMVIVRDWAQERRSAGDSWQRELFEGARFDASAGQVLQGPEVLTVAAQTPGHWLLLRNTRPPEQRPPGWTLVQQGTHWTLLRSAGSAAGGAADTSAMGLTGESPEAAEQKRLAGRQH